MVPTETLTRDLGNGFELRSMSFDEVQSLIEAHYAAVFTGLNPRPNDFLSASEQQQRELLKKPMGSPIQLGFGIFKNNRVVGWSAGYQRSAEEFFMKNSAILPEFQRRGLYTAMLAVVLEKILTYGFQIVSSTHAATNNGVIIPKLKAGFIITGFEISDAFGILVCLKYYNNPLRREALAFRCGQTPPSPALRRIFKLSESNS